MRTFKLHQFKKCGHKPNPRKHSIQPNPEPEIEMKWNSTKSFLQLFGSSALSKHERMLSYKIIVSLCLRTTPGMSARARFERVGDIKPYGCLAWV